MKHQLRSSLLVVSILFLTGIQSCRKDDPAPTYTLNSNCFTRYSFAKTVTAVEATVVNYDASSSAHILRLTVPIQLENRQITNLSACSLPTVLDKENQRLLLSGILLDYNLETANGPLIYGQPFVLTAVKPE